MINWTFIIVGLALFALVIFIFGAPAGTVKKFLTWLGIFK